MVYNKQVQDWNGTILFRRGFQGYKKFPIPSFTWIYEIWSFTKCHFHHCKIPTFTIGEARRLIKRSHLQQRCLDCIICNPRISRNIREWNSRFDQLLQDLQTLFSIFANAQQVASSSAPPPAKELLQPLPEWGIVGMDIQSAKTQLQTLIDAEAPQFRIIAVFGMAGVGKTTLLKSNQCTTSTG